MQIADVKMRGQFRAENWGQFCRNIHDEYVDVFYNDEQKAVFTLHNAVGQSVLTGNLSPQHKRILLTEISMGMYFYTIEFEDGEKVTGKLNVVK